MQATVSQIWFVVHILVGTTFKIFIHVHLIFASVLRILYPIQFGNKSELHA